MFHGWSGNQRFQTQQWLTSYTKDFMIRMKTSRRKDITHTPSHTSTQTHTHTHKITHIPISTGRSENWIGEWPFVPYRCNVDEAQGRKWPSAAVFEVCPAGILKGNALADQPQECGHFIKKGQTTTSDCLYGRRFHVYTPSSSVGPCESRTAETIFEEWSTLNMKFLQISEHLE